MVWGGRGWKVEGRMRAYIKKKKARKKEKEETRSLNR
jgi:hypothetical protein